MHSQRLTDELMRLRTKVDALTDGLERDELLKIIKQHEIAFRLIEWISAPANQRPPFDVVKIRMYRLSNAEAIATRLRPPERGFDDTIELARHIFDAQ